MTLRTKEGFAISDSSAVNNSSVIKNETRYIAVWELILSAAMQAVFLVAGRWNYKVLLGNLLSAPFAVLNFYLMCRTVERTLKRTETDEKEARNFAKMSQTLRSFMIFGIAVIGAAVPCFNTISAILPLLFPKPAAYMRVFFTKKSSSDRGDEHG
ncbi:MAG: hypothetical protein J6M17_06445 [Ruminococcus sp.]|nr:hypothetical protein [Ruminococcus sp.]